MNILSIDLDFMFRDCRNFQQLVDDELPPNLSWQVASYKYEHKQNKQIELDRQALDFVLKIMKSKCANAKDIILVEEHDEVHSHLKKLNIKNSFLTNIDYHHDITYYNDDSDCTLENWVLHSFNDDFVQDYLWIHQPLSGMIEDSPMVYMHLCWKNVDFEQLPNFDYVFICTSKYFTPYEYWHLAGTILDSHYNKNNDWNKYIGLPISMECELSDDKNYYLDKDDVSKDYQILYQRELVYKNYHIIKQYTKDKIIWSYYKVGTDTVNGNELISFLHKCIDYTFDYEQHYMNIVPIKHNYKTNKLMKRIKQITKNKFKMELLDGTKNSYYTFVPYPKTN